MIYRPRTRNMQAVHEKYAEEHEDDIREAAAQKYMEEYEQDDEFALMVDHFFFDVQWMFDVALLNICFYADCVVRTIPREYMF